MIKLSHGLTYWQCLFVRFVLSQSCFKSLYKRLSIIWISDMTKCYIHSCLGFHLTEYMNWISMNCFWIIWVLFKKDIAYNLLFRGNDTHISSRYSNLWFFCCCLFSPLLCHVSSTYKFKCFHLFFTHPVTLFFWIIIVFLMPRVKGKLRLVFIMLVR